MEVTGEEYLFNHSFWTPVGLQVMFGDAQRALEMKENELSGKLDHMQDQRRAESKGVYTVTAPRPVGMDELAGRLGNLIEEARDLIRQLGERGCQIAVMIESGGMLHTGSQIEGVQVTKTRKLL